MSAPTSPAGTPHPDGGKPMPLHPKPAGGKPMPLEPTPDGGKPMPLDDPKN
jgi:hypothetical protein